MSSSPSPLSSSATRLLLLMHQIASPPRQRWPLASGQCPYCWRGYWKRPTNAGHLKPCTAACLMAPRCSQSSTARNSAANWKPQSNCLQQLLVLGIFQQAILLAAVEAIGKQQVANEAGCAFHCTEDCIQIALEEVSLVALAGDASLHYGAGKGHGFCRK